MNSSKEERYNEIADRLVALGFSLHNRQITGQNLLQLEDVYAGYTHDGVFFTVRLPRAWRNFSGTRRNETDGVLIPRLIVEVGGHKGWRNRRDAEAKLLVDPAKDGWWKPISAWIEKQVPLAKERAKVEAAREEAQRSLDERTNALETTMRERTRNLRVFGRGAVVGNDQIVGYRLEIDVAGSNADALMEKINRMLAIANA